MTVHSGPNCPKKWTLIKQIFPPLCIWEYFANLTGALRLVSREGIALLL